MAKGHEYFGAHVDKDNTFVMRQWAPGATEMWLMGDFNQWNKFQHPFKKLSTSCPVLNMCTAIIFGIRLKCILYEMKAARPSRPKSLKVYECHVGISSQEGKVNTYQDFAQHVLPRIKNLGYNAIQVMAVMEHAYYASFGYQVTSFFAASSRYGDPEDLKAVVDKAHEMGLFVMLDCLMWSISMLQKTHWTV